MPKKIKEIAFDNSNLYLYGYDMDSNGNHVVKVGFPNRRGFSIQTNGVLPHTNKIMRKKLHELSQEEIDQVEKEVVDYVQEFGSKEQKATLKTYGKETFEKGGEIKSKEMSEELKKLKATLSSKYTPDALKPKIQAKIDALEAKAESEKPKPEPKPEKEKRKTGANAGKGADRFKLAKKIWDKDGGEKWTDAVRRAGKLQKEGKTGDEPKVKAKKIKKSVKKEAPKPAAKKKIKKSPKAVAKANKMPKKIKKITKLRGTSDKSADKGRKALKAGWRISKVTGKPYFEDRANRADLNRTKKL